MRNWYAHRVQTKYMHIRKFPNVGKHGVRRGEKKKLIWKFSERLQGDVSGRGNGDICNYIVWKRGRGEGLLAKVHTIGCWWCSFMIWVVVAAICWTWPCWDCCCGCWAVICTEVAPIRPVCWLFDETVGLGDCWGTAAGCGLLDAWFLFCLALGDMTPPRFRALRPL